MTGLLLHGLVVLDSNEIRPAAKDHHTYVAAGDPISTNRIHQAYEFSLGSPRVRDQ